MKTISIRLERCLADIRSELTHMMQEDRDEAWDHMWSVEVGGSAVLFSTPAGSPMLFSTEQQMVLEMRYPHNALCFQAPVWDEIWEVLA